MLETGMGLSLWLHECVADQACCPGDLAATSLKTRPQQLESRGLRQCDDAKLCCLGFLEPSCCWQSKAVATP